MKTGRSKTKKTFTMYKLCCKVCGKKMEYPVGWPIASYGAKCNPKSDGITNHEWECYDQYEEKVD